MRSWVFTTKPGHFKMSEALVPGETLDWPTFGRFKFEVGDKVYFYASSPVLQMIGKLEIENLGLNFSEVDPRNDLRKWPKTFSRIPWMRLRVLQSVPVPFKPLQRGSLYYYTEFIPSPYPQLLHENEMEYVNRAFNQAMTYKADIVRSDGGIDSDALERVERGNILKKSLDALKNGHINDFNFQHKDNKVQLLLTSSDDSISVKLDLSGIRRFRWEYEMMNHSLSGVRLKVEDTYLLLNLDGADCEILCDSILVD